MIKKILAVFVVLTFLPITPIYAQQDEYDASVFADNAEYVLQEHFSGTFAVKAGGTMQSRPSGWDMDYRGGKVLARNRGLEIRDTSQKYKISLTHGILPVNEGSFVFETAVLFNSCADMSFSAELLGDAASAMTLLFCDGKIYTVKDGIKTAAADFEESQKIYVKAQVFLDDKKIDLYINNELVQIDIADECTNVNGVSFYTGDKDECNGNIYFVNIYKNYIVNEKFMTAPEGSVPYDFDLTNADTGSMIYYAPGSPYNDDKNGFKLINTAQDAEVSLKKSFANNNLKTTVSWTMLIPQRQDGICVKLMHGCTEEIVLYTSNSDIYVKSYTGSKKIISNYRENFWYNFTVDTDALANCFSVSVNYKKNCDKIKYSGGIVNNIVFSKDASAVGYIMIDDITVCKTFEKYNDYPSEPNCAQTDNINTGMVMYPMWREGTHFGWDAISPYADEREPLLGYYTEGQREVSDWQNKWMAEHGIDYALYPFVRPPSDSGEPVKKPTRGEDLNDGYMNSEYSSSLKFAIYLSAFSAENYHGADELIENVIPYLSEYYFTNPRYMTVNNKLPVFCFSLVNMSEILGGASEVKKVIKAIRAEAQRLGYDDIIFGADAATPSGYALADQIDEDIYIWSYGSVTDDVDCIKQKIDGQYEYSQRCIPSISMGYDPTPWRISETGMFTPEDIRSICTYVKQKNEFKASDEKMVLFTCWNEYGEGHYFAPSAKSGFDYLNVIRDTFTVDGINENEQLPTEAAYARMNALYLPKRGALKTMPDRQYTDEDMQSRDVLYSYKFNDDNYSLWKTNNCKTTGFSDGVLDCTATGNDPQIYCKVDTKIDISKVKAIKIRAKISTGLQMYYSTTDNPNYGEGKKFITDIQSNTDEYKEYVLNPYKFEEGKYPAISGNITSFRIDPADDIYLKNANFGVDWFELYSDEDMKSENMLYRYEFDADNYSLWKKNNCTVKFSGSCIEYKATANDPQVYCNIDTGIDIANIKAIKIRAKAGKGLRIFYSTTDNPDFGGGKMFLTDRLSKDDEYTEMILYPRDITRGITYPAPTGTVTNLRIDPSDDIYLGNGNFGIDWFELYGDNTNVKLFADNEQAELTCAPVIKNGTVYIPVYSVLINEMNAYALWNEESKTLYTERDGNTITVTADSNTVTVNGQRKKFNNVPFYEKGNLFVPYDEFLPQIGYAVEYDEDLNTISCTSKTVQLFSIVAVTDEYGENIARRFQSTNVNDFSYYRLPQELNVEQVDNRTALKLVPEQAGADSLFSIAYVNYNGKRCRLNEVVADGKKMKLTFSCKGVCDKVVLENREGSKRQSVNPEINDIDCDVWKDYSFVFDNNGIEVVDGDVRWLTFRIKSNTEQTPYLYISDLKLQCLEETETSKYDTDIKFRITAPVNLAESIPYECYVAEYAKDGSMVLCKNILSGDTSNEGDYIRYYNYTPKAENTVKVFMWSGMSPLCTASTVVPMDKN